MIHGFLVINKEQGVTSHQVVARLRQILNQPGIGHSGTLDPEATGVLVVGLGEATRTFQFLNEETKVYRAEMIVGQSTDTQDTTGSVLEDHPDCFITSAELEAKIEELTGNIEQIPPMYSAVKVKGKKLYELARCGMTIERETRKIKVYRWIVINPQPSYKYRETILSEIYCSKGTYIRTLLHDLGVKLRCGAHMGKLIRLSSGNFKIESALTLNEVQELYTQGRLLEKVITINQALNQYQTLHLKEEDTVKFKNGGKVSGYWYPLDVTVGTVVKCVSQTAEVIGMAELKAENDRKYWQPVKVFRYESK